MTVGSWAIDPQGINNGGTQLYVTSRTMAKLGLLYLNNGTWNGREIMTEQYVTQSVSPHAVTDATMHYGYQWWLSTDEGMYSARGSNGQYILVFPEYNIVISINANADEYGEDINEDIIEYVLNSVLEETTTGTTSGTDSGPTILLPIIGFATVIMVVVVAILKRNS
jgi:CubicO group peptidase (beta-lactamase class C family)